MASSINCMFAALAFALAIQSGTALQCWICHSDSSSQCEYLGNATEHTRISFLRDCNSQQSQTSYGYNERYICRKIVYTQGGRTTTSRQCDTLRADERDIKDGPCGHQIASEYSTRSIVSCNICSTDACNSGTSITGSRLFQLFAIILAVTPFLTGVKSLGV
ncbi:uncharacterized protein LOC107035905 [Diachasma alloeum]|uniref:uncharacterized protein LOC107035905 n=1 Tax=Diachasma alloeum TaxID=454923 RepID=UPI000738104B|nr:uncharacterized protein LOC107035905 [Diachasma alloeum]